MHTILRQISLHSSLRRCAVASLLLATVGLIPPAIPTARAGIVRVIVPRVLQVPGDFDTIQKAIDDAHSGDKIVFRGTFNGDLDLKGKRLIIIIVQPTVASLVADAAGTATQPQSVAVYGPGASATMGQIVPPSPENEQYRAYYAQPRYSSDPTLGPVYRPFDYRAIYFVDGQPVEVLPPPYPDYYFTRPEYYYPSYYTPYYPGGGYSTGSSLAGRAPIYTITPDRVRSRRGSRSGNNANNNSSSARGSRAGFSGVGSSGLFQMGPTGGAPSRRGPTAGFGSAAGSRLRTGANR
jgi:hypothetical protein